MATAAALWGWLRPKPAEPLTQFSVALADDEALQPPLNTGGRAVAISRDGRAIAYLGPGEGGPRLWVRRLDQLSRDADPGDRGRRQPLLLARWQAARIHHRMDVGTHRLARRLALVTLTDKANSTAGDWGDDGYVYFEVDSGLGRMKPTGGAIEPVYNIVTKAGNEVGAEWPCVLPAAKASSSGYGVRAGTGRLQHRGDEAAERPATRADPRHLRPLRANRPSPRRHLGREAHRAYLSMRRSSSSPALPWHSSMAWASEREGSMWTWRCRPPAL